MQNRKYFDLFLTVCKLVLIQFHLPKYNQELRALRVSLLKYNWQKYCYDYLNVSLQSVYAIPYEILSIMYA